MQPNNYEWHINCTDINGYENSSNKRIFTIIKSYNFKGKTTDFSLINIEDIENLIIEQLSFGLINFTENINLSGGADINSYISLSNNLISLDSNYLPQLNKSAKLTLYNINFEKPIILKNNVTCTDCEILSYEKNNNITICTSYIILIQSLKIQNLKFGIVLIMK